MNLGVDPRHADQMVRGVVNLPNGTGQTRARRRLRPRRQGRRGEGRRGRHRRRRGSGRDRQNGKIDFDRCIATPDMMPLVGRLGKVLGPRGMMPNPKVGTVTTDVAAAVKASRAARSSSGSRRPASSTPASARPRSTQGARRERPRLRRCGDQGEAVGRQGQLRQEDVAQLDHGPGPEARPATLAAS